MFKKIVSLCLASLLTVPVIGSVSSAADASTENAPQSLTTQVSTQAYDWGRVKIGGGGFIPGIIFNPSEQGLAYVRTDMGGAYRWDTATDSWKQLLDGVSYDEWNMAGVESIATDPVDPDRVYLAAGTYSNDFTDQTGVMLRSSDRGETWERTRLPIKFGGNMPGRSMGERLAVDPNNNSIIYFGARNGEGLWRSTDYGVTWAKVESFDVPQNQKDYYGGEFGPVWIVFDESTGQRADEAAGTAAKTTQTLYVGVADSDTSIYRSTDGGSTWEPVAGQPDQGYIPHHGILASNGELYVSYNKNSGPYDGIPWDGTGVGAVWKFNTATGEWTDITPPVIAPTDSASVPSYPFGGLAVDPSNPDTVMVSTLNLWWPDDHIFRSTDGGTTWNSFWKQGDGYTRVNNYTIDYADSPWLDWGRTSSPTDMEQNPKLGWMIGDLEIDPFDPDHFFYGTGATLYGSNSLTNLDKGMTVGISVYSQGIEETAILGLISPPEGDAKLISSMGDIGGFRHVDLGVSPEMITNPYMGSSTDLDFAQNNSNLIVRVGNAENTDARMGISQDNGATWTPAANSWTAANGDKTGGGWTAVAADGSSIVWAPASAAEEIATPVSFSTDLGASWKASTGIPQGAMVSSDRVNPDKFYGYADGKFYVSNDGGASFKVSAADNLPVKVNSKFKAVSGVEGDIWLVAAKDNTNTESEYGVFHSTDSGATFTKLANVEEAIMIGFGKAAPGKTYDAIYINGRINGQFGFYRSDDAGASWIRINDEDHQYANATQAITGDPRVYGRVYIGTNGFGIVTGDIKPVTVPTPTPTPTPAPVQGGTPVSTPSPTAPVQQVTGSVLHVTAPVGSDGSAAVEITEDNIRKAAAGSTNKEVTVKVAAPASAKQLSAAMPVKLLASLREMGIKTIHFVLNDVALSVSTDALKDSSAAAAGNLKFTSALADPAALSAEAKEKIAGNPVYDLNLTIDGKQAEWKDRKVTVSLPYALKSGEKPGKVVVYYLAESGAAEVVKGASWDAVSKSVIFTPKHFSKYAVSYVNVKFGDIARYPWAVDAIQALAAQGIVSGYTEETFVPSGGVTRAQFIQMLVNVLELKDSSAASTFKDVQAGSWYYASAATAQKLGIVKGRPDGTLGVNDTILREEMSVMLYRAMQAKGNDLSAVQGTVYADQAAISGYAQEAVAKVSAAGIVSGQGNNSFAPRATANRAEAAVMIRNLLHYLLDSTDFQ